MRNEADSDLQTPSGETSGSAPSVTIFRYVLSWIRIRIKMTVGFVTFIFKPSLGRIHFQDIHTIIKQIPRAKIGTERLDWLGFQSPNGFMDRLFIWFNRHLASRSKKRDLINLWSLKVKYDVKIWTTIKVFIHKLVKTIWG